MPRITTGRIQDLSLPNSNLISVDARRLGLSILARGESVPVPVSVPVTFTCIASVPRLLNCVLRYILFARPAPWRVSAMLVQGLAARERPLWTLLTPSSGLRVGVSGWLRCARLRYETGTLALHPSTTFNLQRACERARQQCSGSLHPPPGSSPNLHLSPLPKRSLLCSIVFFFGLLFAADLQISPRRRAHLEQTTISGHSFFFLTLPSSFRCCDCRRPYFTPSRRAGFLCFSVYNPSKSTSPSFDIARTCFGSCGG